MQSAHYEKKLRLALVCVAAAGVLGAAAGHAAESIEQRLAAEPKGRVEINAAGGAIHCIGWDEPQVLVSGVLGSDAKRLEVRREGSTILVRVVRRFIDTGGEATQLTVKVPKAGALSVAAVSADVDVRDFDGELRLRSVSGDVQLRGVGGDLNVETVSGGADVRMTHIRRLRLKGISGDMLLTGSLDADAQVDATSVSGELRLILGGAEHAHVRLDSVSGDINSCLGGVAAERPPYEPGSSLNYGRPDAASSVRAKTLSGAILLCNR